MASDDPVCNGILMFGGGILLLLYGVGRYLLVQKINNTPTSKVRSAAVGLVELFGKAKCKEAVTSPVSKQRCTYFRILCEYYQPGKHGGWRSIYARETRSEFCLEDDSGSMLVDPKEGEVSIPADFKSVGHLSDKGFLGMQQQLLDPKVFSFLDENPNVKKAFNMHKDRNLRVTEWFIAEGDPLYVLGSAEPKKGPASAVGHENLVLKMGRDGILYISDSGEKKIAGDMRRTAWLSIAGGALLGGIGLVLLLSGLKII